MSVTISEAYRSAWQRGLDFSGRSTRPEYWWVTLVNVVIAVLFFILATSVSRVFTVINDIYFLAYLIPGIALSIRRLHDSDRTGWWWLIAFIPILGTLWLIWLEAQPSDDGPNRFGALPAASEGEGYLTQ